MDNSNYMFQMHLLQKEQQLRQMEAEFKALQHEYHNILNSRFWKSTQWIRNIINKVRRHADYKPVFIDNPRQQDGTVFPTRLPAEEMINTLKTYDIISFDIFDSLILRNCRNPVDVFDIVALKIGYESFSSLVFGSSTFICHKCMVALAAGMLTAVCRIRSYEICSSTNRVVEVLSKE